MELNWIPILTFKMYILQSAIIETCICLGFKVSINSSKSLSCFTTINICSIKEKDHNPYYDTKGPFLMRSPTSSSTLHPTQPVIRWTQRAFQDSVFVDATPSACNVLSPKKIDYSYLRSNVSKTHSPRQMYSMITFTMLY